jgi:hypothetical protein
MDLNLDQQNLISILGIQALSDERKAEVLDQASSLIQKRLLVRAMESLDDAKKQEFQTLLENTNSEGLNAFMVANLPQFNEWMVEEVNNLKKQFADLAGNLE